MRPGTCCQADVANPSPIPARIARRSLDAWSEKITRDRKGSVLTHRVASPMCGLREADPGLGLADCGACS
jgi:hypothetical protein